MAIPSRHGWRPALAAVAPLTRPVPLPGAPVTGPAPVAVAAARSPASPSWRAGIAWCLVSAVSFGALPVLGKGALDAGVGPLGLLLSRFAITAVIFGLLLAAGRPRRPPARPEPAPRWLAAALAMGFAGYAVEAALFFLALERIDASLTELLLYAYPVIVTVVAVLLGRERPSTRLAGALMLASIGLVLVFAGSLATGADPVGLALGLGAAAVYAGYVLTGERVVAVVDPMLMAALVASGATLAFVAAGLAGADLGLPTTAAAWRSVVLVALVATVLPMVALFAGIERVGASTASIVSTLEPVVTVALAAALLGEHLTGMEAAGALAVLVAVGILQTRRAGATTRRAGPGRPRLRGPVAPSPTPPPSAARPARGAEPGWPREPHRRPAAP